MSDHLIDYFDYVRYLPYVPSFALLVAVFVYFKARMTKYPDSELMSGDINAVGISFAGALGGVLLASSGSLIGSSESMWTDWAVHLFQGAIAVVVTLLAQNVIDVVVLPRIENDLELQRNNKAVATVEACSYLGVGMIMASSFAGSDPSFWNGTLSTVVFSTIGVITVCVFYKIYDLVNSNTDDQVASGSIANALEAGGVVLGSATLLAFSIYGDSTSWKEDLLIYVQGALMAGVMVVAIRVLIRILLNILPLKAKGASASLAGFILTIGLSFTGGWLIIN